MSDGKKTDVPGAPLNDTVPSETPKLLQQDLGLDRRAPRPVPGFDQLQKPARPVAKPNSPLGPEFAPTVISNKDRQPSPLDYVKTEPSAANPVLAKLQAAERAAHERAVAERQLAERTAAERAVNERLVASRAAGLLRPPVPSQQLPIVPAGPGVAAPRAPAPPVHLKDPSLLQTDPLRMTQPSPLRQQLASRPLGPPAAAPVPSAAKTGEVITDPMPRGAVAPAPSRPSAATVVQRPPPAPLPVEKTDPMSQPDVPGALARGPRTPLPLERTESNRPALQAPPGLVARPPASAPVAVTRPMSPVERTAPLAAFAADAPAEPTEIALPAITAPRPLPGVAMPASASARTEVGRPLPPGISMSPASERTEVARPLPPGLRSIPPGVAMPAAAMRTDVTRPAPQPAIEAPAVPEGGPLVTQSPVKQVSAEDLAPIPERPPVPQTLPAPIAAVPVPAAAPPARAKVVPPSFVDLPAAMEQPRDASLDYATTQPGIPGPYWKPQATRAPEPAKLPTDTASDFPRLTPSPDDALPSDQVIASPASLWRRVISYGIDFAVLGGAVLGLLMLAVGVIGGKAVPNNLHGIDVFFFRLHPILIPAIGLTALMAILYTTLGAFLLKGRTLGRLLLGIRLVDASGEAPGLVRSLLRSIFAIFSFVFFLAGFWLALFDRRGQTLHDKLTRTFVVRPV